MGKIEEKNSAWNLTKVRSKKEVIDEARANGAIVHVGMCLLGAKDGDSIFPELRLIARGFSHNARTLQRQAEQPQPRP